MEAAAVSKEALTVGPSSTRGFRSRGPSENLSGDKKSTLFSNSEVAKAAAAEAGALFSISTFITEGGGLLRWI
jgi:hypothetical protein